MIVPEQERPKAMLNLWHGRKQQGFVPISSTKRRLAEDLTNQLWYTVEACETPTAVARKKAMQLWHGRKQQGFVPIGSTKRQLAEDLTNQLWYTVEPCEIPTGPGKRWDGCWGLRTG
jgi:hypothetical protein